MATEGLYKWSEATNRIIASAILREVPEGRRVAEYPQSLRGL